MGPQIHIMVGSVFMDSANCGSKIFGKKKSVCSADTQTFFLSLFPQTIQSNNYLHSVYIVLDIISNLEMI